MRLLILSDLLQRNFDEEIYLQIKSFIDSLVFNYYILFV